MADGCSYRYLTFLNHCLPSCSVFLASSVCQLPHCYLPSSPSSFSPRFGLAASNFRLFTVRASNRTLHSLLHSRKVLRSFFFTQVYLHNFLLSFQDGEPLSQGLVFNVIPNEPLIAASIVFENLGFSFDLFPERFISLTNLCTATSFHQQK